MISACTITAPIDVKTQSTTVDTDMMVVNFKSGDCTATKLGAFVVLKYTSTTNTVTYKNIKYEMAGIMVFNRSLHTIDGKYSAGELIIKMHSPTLLNPTAILNICIPITITLDSTKSSFGELLKTGTFPKTVSNFGSPKIFIPIGDFYSYTGSDFDRCSTQQQTYIVFPSSSVKMTTTELAVIPLNTRKITQNAGIVYHHSQQSATEVATTIANQTMPTDGDTTMATTMATTKAVTFGDEDVYIDCQQIGSESGGTADTASSTTQPQSISFSKMKDNKFVQMFLMFLAFIIVMVIFFYSYEFTTSMFRELTRTVAKKL